MLPFARKKMIAMLLLFFSVVSLWRDRNDFHTESMIYDLKHVFHVL